MKDIETREDIALLMREFYNRLLADPAISYIFTDVAKIDLEAHIPHLTDFWELSVLHTGSYKKNVMQLHLDLNNKERLTNVHFDVWLNHFNQSVDDLFSGSNAEKIKTRALSIATIMKIKIHTT
ncbi:group III truncated hemoglobin [Flavobacterium sp.]|uniref:group III truncated hemoglobin n=1 Tax=Flavobacterium sp. TaxID=239 RepID=UPI003A927338